MPVQPVAYQPSRANVDYAIAALRFEIALVREALRQRRIKAGFNPDQPRDEQGRWSGDGAVSAQRRRGGLGRFPNATPGEAAGLAAAEAQAGAANARAQAVDPNFRPSPSFSETIQGEIAARLAEAREAEAHVRAIEAYHASRPAIERLMPLGREVGEQWRRADDKIRTLSSEHFRHFTDFVLRDAEELSSYSTYSGRAFASAMAALLACTIVAIMARRSMCSKAVTQYSKTDIRSIDDDRTTPQQAIWRYSR